MARQFFTLDVFTNKALGGNPLAVVMNSEGLDDQRMQAIAGEFNLSETVFVLPPADSENRASLRIFTPKKELPFAGHPTVGTATLLAIVDGMQAGSSAKLVLEEKVGPVSCVASRKGDLSGAQFSLPKLPQREVVELDDELLAQALGIGREQLGVEGHENSICNAGVPFPIIGLKDLDAMAAISIDEAALDKCFANFDVALELYVYTRQCIGEDCAYHTRMFAPAFGIAEDPATGSAAASFAAQIMACDKPADGAHVFGIEQGIEMGRPSRIELSMEVANGKLARAIIGGSAIIVSEGKLYL